MKRLELPLVDELRAIVASGILLPGVKLMQVELAKQLEASPVPVREALKLLTSEGLVEHDPNRGFHVARTSGKEVRLLFRMQHLLEDELLLSLEWPLTGQLSDIKQYAADLDDFTASDGRREWWLKQRNFQQALYGLSPHAFTAREAMRLWALTSRFLWLFSTRQEWDVHLISGKAHAIAQALADRDRERLISSQAQLREFVERKVLEIVQKDSRASY